jgi:Sap-like sulfolipid-1-addressing protein
MADLLTKLIPTALAGAINVVPITIVVTLLMAKGGLARAIAFGIGQLGSLVAIGGIALATASTNAGSTDTGSAVTGTVIAMVGGLLLILALKQLLGAPDPDAPPPAYMAKLESMSVSGALVTGLVLGLVNVKQLGIYVAGIAEIVEADVSAAQGWVALAILFLLIQIGVIAPILAYVFARDWATKTLTALRGWLIAHNRVISIVLGLVVGALFVIAGVAQITG